MNTQFHVATNTRRGFTLVELMVVLVIISILSSLTLAGLNVARLRGKIDKTRSTISKLHSAIIPHFESYADRSVTVTGSTRVQVATSRMVNRRSLQLYEMPDCWSDVINGVAAVTGGGSTVPAYARTGTVRGYAAFRAGATPNTANESAECLYMIVARSGFDPYVIEHFRNDEVGDVDTDGASEFLDAWGKPIIFLRWAPGFSPYSAIQIADAATHHDPMDPEKMDAAGYGLIPLIVSGGPDGQTGLQVASSGWLPLSLTSLVTSGANVGALDPNNSSAYRDNITNHNPR